MTKTLSVRKSNSQLFLKCDKIRKKKESIIDGKTDKIMVKQKIYLT